MNFKKNTIVATAVSVVMLLSGCGSSNGGTTASATVPEIAKGVTECGVTFNGITEVPTDRLSAYYGIQDTDYSEGDAYVAGSGGYADEIAIFKASSSDAVSTIEDALNSRLESRKNDFKDYVAEQYDIINDSKVLVNGDYVCLIVCADNSTAIDTYNSYFE